MCRYVSLLYSPKDEIGKSGGSPREKAYYYVADDPKDSYAETYIASLTVNGSFLVEGTKENPVNIYPSDLMSDYIVDISEKENGYVSLKFAELINLTTYTSDNKISYADHCTFRFNYGDTLLYRTLDSGKVTEHNTYYAYLPNFALVKDSVFYKIGLINAQEVRLNGTAQRCIFADCGITFGSDFTAQNCVFLGNTFLDQTKPNQIKNSSLQVTDTIALDKLDDYSFDFYYREDTGTTYVQCTTPNYSKTNKELAEGIKKVFGGNFAKFETLEELKWLYDNGCNNYNSYYVGNLKGKNGELQWYDGTPVDKAFLSDSISLCFYEKRIRFDCRSNT